MRYEISWIWEPNNCAKTQKNKLPFQRLCCQFFPWAMRQYHVTIPGRFHSKKWEMPGRVSRKKRTRGNLNYQKVGFVFFQCLQVLVENVWAQKYVPGILSKENVYNTFMGSSKQMIGYLHHRKALTIIWSWKIVGIKQEINAIYLKIPRLCVK